MKHGDHGCLGVMHLFSILILAFVVVVLVGRSTCFLISLSFLQLFSFNETVLAPLYGRCSSCRSGLRYNSQSKPKANRSCSFECWPWPCLCSCCRWISRNSRRHSSPRGWTGRGGGEISLRNLVMFRQQQQQQTEFKEFTGRAFFPFPLFKSSPFSLIICLTGAWEHIIVSPSTKDLVLKFEVSASVIVCTFSHNVCSTTSIYNIWHAFWTTLELQTSHIVIKKSWRHWRHHTLKFDKIQGKFPNSWICAQAPFSLIYEMPCAPRQRPCQSPYETEHIDSCLN